MTAPLTPAKIKAEQIRATLAAKLPISLAFDAMEAEGLREFLALRQSFTELVKDNKVKSQTE